MMLLQKDGFMIDLIVESPSMAFLPFVTDLLLSDNKSASPW